MLMLLVHVWTKHGSDPTSSFLEKKHKVTSKAFALFNDRAWKEGPLIHYAGSILLYEMDF